jgi:hypothetical protein
MHNSPIRNNTLLQEAYKAGYYRALYEGDTTPGHPSLGPDGGTESGPTGKTPQSKHDRSRYTNRGKSYPAFNARDYFNDTYGGWGQWLMDMLAGWLGRGWVQYWEQIMNHEGFRWPAPNWTPNGSGGYYYNGELPPGVPALQVAFVNGVWTFQFAVH